MCSALRREVQAVKGISATSASEIQRPSSWSQSAFGYLIATQSASPIEAIAVRTAGSLRAVTEKCAPPQGVGKVASTGADLR
jgi:hypothetical protein